MRKLIGIVLIAVIAFGIYVENYHSNLVSGESSSGNKAIYTAANYKPTIYTVTDERDYRDILDKVAPFADYEFLRDEMIKHNKEGFEPDRIFSGNEIWVPIPREMTPAEFIAKQYE